MSGLRDTLDLLGAVKPESGQAVLEHELMAERAASLGAAEKKAIAALGALRAAGDERPARLVAARAAVWAYFVQRELIGFRSHQDVIKTLGITGDVLNGLGIVHTRKSQESHP